MASAAAEPLQATCIAAAFFGEHQGPLASCMRLRARGLSACLGQGHRSTSAGPAARGAPDRDGTPEMTGRPQSPPDEVNGGHQRMKEGHSPSMDSPRSSI